MEVSSKIKELVELALSDRVLTFVERKTIVDAALKEGVSEEDINRFLDNALRERLQHYTKENLKRCPHCGGQIPLISDTCLFCGESLEEKTNTNPEPINISGEEAEIIRRENLRTAEETKNIKTCPDCGAPFPLISNICPNCGHVLHEQSDSDLNVKNLIADINQSIEDLKAAPQINFAMLLWHYRSIVFLIIGFFIWWCCVKNCIATDHPQKPGMYMIALPILFVMAWRGWRAYDEREEQDNDLVKAEKAFYKSLFRQEKFSRQLKTIYGTNKEAQSILDKFSTTIDNIKKRRHNIKKRLWVSTAVAVCLILLMRIIMSSSIDKWVQDSKFAPQCKQIEKWSMDVEDVMLVYDVNFKLSIKIVNTAPNQTGDDAEIIYMYATDVPPNLPPSLTHFTIYDSSDGFREIEFHKALYDQDSIFVSTLQQNTMSLMSTVYDPENKHYVYHKCQYKFEDEYYEQR